MPDLKKASAEYLIFLYAHNKEQLINSSMIIREIEEEMKRRKPTYLDRYSKGDMPIETEFEIVTGEGEVNE